MGKILTRLVMDGRTVATSEISDEYLDIKGGYRQVSIRFTETIGLPDNLRIDMEWVEARATETPKGK